MGRLIGPSVDGWIGWFVDRLFGAVVGIAFPCHFRRSVGESRIIFGCGDSLSIGASVRDIRCSLKREPRFGGMEGTEEPGRSKFIVVFDVLRCGLLG